MNIPKTIMMDDEDPYNIGGYSSSDDDRNESSDDEFVTGGFFKHQKQETDSSSEDEFEKEMDLELESVMRTYEQGDQGVQNANSNSGKDANGAMSSSNNAQSGDATKDKNDVYAEEYFSSGSDDEHQVGGQASKSKERRKVLTNDELLYDPDMDDEDEQWVIKQRQEHRQRVQETESNSNATGTVESQESSSMSKKKTKKSKENVEKVPSSDAILSCPACMTTLCIDCQRHDLYKNQYRAMFVMNCKVVEDEVLRYEPSQQQNKGKKRKKAQKGGKLVQHRKAADNMTSIDSASSERYHPVTCTDCNSEVAVYDSDEVYHFFNVLASHA